MSGNSDLLCSEMAASEILVLKVFRGFLQSVLFSVSLYMHTISLLPFLAHVKACLIKLLTCTAGECCGKYGNFYAMLHTLIASIGGSV